MLKFLSSKSCKKQRGFTILETLISLSIISMILLLLGSGMKLITSSWDRNIQRMEEQGNLSRLAEIFRRDIEAIRRIYEQKEKRKVYNFSGDKSQLTFITREPSYPTVPGLYHVRYLSENKGNKKVLKRLRKKYRSYKAGDKQTSFRDSVALLEGRYDYSFLFGKDGEKGIIWTNKWSLSDKLPDLIRLNVIQNNKTSSFLARTQITAEQECISANSPLCSVNKTGEGDKKNRSVFGSGKK